MNRSAEIIKISGPVVVCNQPGRFAMGDRVTVGEAGIVGEVIIIAPDQATLQVYEDTTGLRIGEPVHNTGAPLSVELGPGLIGTIYDGIQRPLDLLLRECGDFTTRGVSVTALDRDRLWRFKPAQEEGAVLSGGTVMGHVQETPSICHAILLPPGMSGTLEHIAPSGEYRLDDPIGCIRSAMDGKEHDILMFQRWPIRHKRPVTLRMKPGLPLITGQRIIDTFFPIAKGGTAAIPGGFGTGKTVTQHNLAKWCDADVIVYIGCGERGNEMTGVLTEFPQLQDPRSGRSLIERTVLIANTSNMPVAAREASIYTGITMAEYFRDQGMDVALMADSTSRWAEALREISGRLEEMPAEEGFPAYLPTRIAEFYERAGRVKTLAGDKGSISAIGSVSPPGGDFSEPVTLHTQRFVKAYWALDKALANARFFPAIHPLESYSEYAADLAAWWGQLDAGWYEDRNEAMHILLEADKLKRIVRIMGEDGLSPEHRKVLLGERLIRDGFLQQSAFHGKDRYASPEKQAGLLKLIMRTIRAMRTDETPVTELAGKYRLDAIIRLKDEVASEDAEQLSQWTPDTA